MSRPSISTSTDKSRELCSRTWLVSVLLLGKHVLLINLLTVDQSYTLMCFSWYCYISILSLAVVARQNNYVRPILTEDSLLEIHNGRLVFFIVDFYVTPPSQIISRFSFSRCIDFTMHLDIYYVQMHSKIYLCI